MRETKLDERGVVIRCRSCRARNRIAYGQLSQQNRCGECKSTLPPPDEAIDVRSEGEFYAATRDSEVPTLVDFWAKWCGPCRMMAPELDRVASANAGQILVLKVNTEEHPGLANAFRVRSIPSMSIFFRGQTIGRTEGARPAADIQRFLDQSLTSAAR